MTLIVYKIAIVIVVVMLEWLVESLVDYLGLAA